jgi:formate hydrogenlyase transcriptional activator
MEPIAGFLVPYHLLRNDQGQQIRWYLACTDIDDRKGADVPLLQENVALREEIAQTSMFEDIVGTSPALSAALSRVSRPARGRRHSAGPQARVDL